MAPGYREVIEHARALLPDAIRERVDHARFLTGVDPGFAGLHRYGAPFHQWAHACDPDTHLSTLSRAERHPTVVLPQDFRAFERTYVKHDPPAIVVHELGHILDFALPWRPEVRPVTAYARTNRLEAFAEAFEAHFAGDHRLVAASAPEAVAFFEELAA